MEINIVGSTRGVRQGVKDLWLTTVSLTAPPRPQRPSRLSYDAPTCGAGCYADQPHLLSRSTGFKRSSTCPAYELVLVSPSSEIDHTRAAVTLSDSVGQVLVTLVTACWFTSPFYTLVTACWLLVSASCLRQRPYFCMPRPCLKKCAHT